MKKIIIGMLGMLALFALFPAVFADQTPFINLARVNATLTASGNVGNNSMSSIIVSFYGDSNLQINVADVNSDGTFSSTKDTSSFPQQVSGYSACMSVPNATVNATNTLLCSQQVVSSWVTDAPTRMQQQLDSITNLLNQFSNLTNITDMRSGLQNVSADLNELKASQIKQSNIDDTVNSAKSDLQNQIAGLSAKIDSSDADTKTREGQLEDRLTGKINFDETILVIAIMVSVTSMAVAILLSRRKKNGKVAPVQGEKPAIIMVAVSGELTDEKLNELGRKLSESLKPSENNIPLKETKKKDQPYWAKFGKMVY